MWSYFRIQNRSIRNGHGRNTTCGAFPEHQLNPEIQQQFGRLTVDQKMTYQESSGGWRVEAACGTVVGWRESRARGQGVRSRHNVGTLVGGKSHLQCLQLHIKLNTMCLTGSASWSSAHHHIPSLCCKKKHSTFHSNPTSSCVVTTIKI